MREASAAGPRDAGSCLKPAGGAFGGHCATESGRPLHDLQNPAKVIGVGDSWILQPEDPWEITGYVHNMVFTCGAVSGARWNRENLLGGADTVMCVGEANVSDLVALCLDHGRPAK